MIDAKTYTIEPSGLDPSASLAAWGSRHVHRAAAVVSDECGHEVQMRYFCPTCEKRVRGSTVSVGRRPARKGTRPRRPTR